jgi:hypothetical protein
MVGASERILRWAKQYNVKVVFGTDLLFEPDGTYKENLMLTRLAKVYRNVEVLKITTSGNCTLFARSGNRNPYKEAKLGVFRKARGRTCCWSTATRRRTLICWRIRSVTLS